MIVPAASAAGGLSPSEIEALNLALNDENRAWATYDQVVADLGPITPFTKIVAAEQTHIDALMTLFNRYGLEVPPNPWPGNVPGFDTRPEACAAGVAAETANVALYDQLLGMVNHRDIIRLFATLRTVSLTNHLPALERCAPWSSCNSRTAPASLRAGGGFPLIWPPSQVSRLLKGGGMAPDAFLCEMRRVSRFAWSGKSNPK